jgi:hypothetical protein
MGRAGDGFATLACPSLLSEMMHEAVLAADGAALHI